MQPFGRYKLVSSSRHHGMHTYVRTLTNIVKRPQLIDGALRSDQTTLIPTGVIQAMRDTLA